MKLGDTLKCKLTGFKGIAVIRVEYLNGNIQFALLPKSDGKTYPDSKYIDSCNLEFIDNGVTDRIIPTIGFKS